MPGPELVNNDPTRTVSSRYISHFDRFIALRIGDHCLIQP